MKAVETLAAFAEIIFQFLKSDRDVVVGVGGFTGEGKSTFTTKLQKEYAKVSGTPWGFHRMTWSRDELLKWIDGKEGSEPGPDGLREGQLPEYSAILPDELFTMFYRRNWYDDDQISAIATFNMCRDRHLFVAGNVPDFWDLDTGFVKRVRFYVYIPERGRAWIFQQENNPFATDPWNISENRKSFRKKKNPYSIKNFVCEIHFPDWDPEEKKQYYRIRNEKRLLAIKEGKKKKRDRYANIKGQRDNIMRSWVDYMALTKKEIIKLCCESCKKALKKTTKPLSDKVIGEVVGMSSEAVRLIKGGQR